MYIITSLIGSLLIAVVGCNVADNRIEKFKDSDGNCNVPDNLRAEIHNYQATVDRIVKAVVNGPLKGKTWQSLAELVDKFGPRMSGSHALESAIDYVVETMQAGGMENVHTEEAKVPHWTRGYENAQMVAPRTQNLNILGLGSTVGTPRGGIIADVVAVESFQELSVLPDSAIQGKIVVFAPKWESYGKTVEYRLYSAKVAAKRGAVAALVRSVTPFSLATPHTGLQEYDETIKKIPVASLTVEDALTILRMCRRNETVRIHLEMEDRNLPLFTSRNTVGELQGSIFKDTKVVVVSGHLDSWDVGVGAMDDGGGAMISWKAVEFLKALNLRPKRTIRAILWTGEEQGYQGAKDYEAAHKATESEEFSFFLESDMGTFEPRGLGFSGNGDAECLVREVLKLMSPLNATTFDSPSDGPDISRWTDRGFPSASLLNKNDEYFWYHHSAADSMLVESPDNLDKCTALWAAAAYVIADLSVDMPKDIVRQTPESDEVRRV